ncbi:MAG TPA: hypothetical protein VFL12_02475, partial [Thermoanaerobaculia bacterium]|nr:hypothetical protein [Thermoanaerobaculia bacterium]
AHAAARRGRPVRRLGRRAEIDRRADAARARRDPRWRPYGFLLALALRRLPLALRGDAASCRAGSPRLAVPRAPPRAA